MTSEMTCICINNAYNARTSGVRPSKQNSCFTSFHSQSAHVEGGYLY